MFLSEIDAVEPNFNARNNREASFCGIGDRRKRIDRRNLKRKFNATQSRQFGGEHQEIGRVTKRWKRPRKREGEREAFDRVVAFGDIEHLVFEPDHDSRVDFE